MKLKTIALLGLLLAPSAFTAEQPAKLVSIVEVQNRPLSPKINIIGSVYSRQSAELTAGIEGKLEWVQDAGTIIKKGDVVARIEQTRLMLDKAKQQAQIEHDQVSLKRLERKYKRLEKLNQSNHASGTQMDDAKSQRDLALANLKLTKLQLDVIEDDIRRTELRAPFSGIITQRLRQAGEDINRATSIVSITDPDRLEARLHAPLRHSKRVRVGDELKVYHNGGDFVATVRSLIPVSDVRSQTFEIRMDLPIGIEDSFSVGELISLALPIAPKTLTTLVPRDAVVLRSNGAFVFKIDSENKAHKIPVELGDGDGEWIAVSGDIEAQDKVVIRGAETLQEGQLVKISKMLNSV
ncbi:efflux RND transporter periplasmic adaptor subunit [Shewanella sp. 202IG2-18]|uniref:efflux RND transporter periplasmic adaptor subunit n=1 Tax=Parashewanella hymeniacidonis TaxID=2807618 RepID=UPI0019617823|nr:efflux RND transporter periplasmic adaptor subunit [Parashewanella hymeniacidonis]MBM7073346.1 efflux RND transporter periplasmic adaptor subunit [Parashewanella hymeniacidonis]